MGAKAEMVNGKQEISAANDCIVIRKANGYIIGGRTLDMTDFDGDVIKAGHLVIQSKTDESIFKPMPVSNGAYAALPEGYKYVGVVRATKPADDPRVSIVYDGEINDKACPYPFTDAIKTALQSAQNVNLVFMHD